MTSEKEQAIAVLVAARTKISDRWHWTKGTMARDKHGFSAFDVERAHCFCSVGAVRTVATGQFRYENVYSRREALVPSSVYHEAVVALRAAALSVLGHRISATAKASDTFIAPIISANDHPSTTHEDVLAMFDAAIVALKSA